MVADTDEDLKLVSFADAGKMTGYSRETIRRWAMDPDYEDLQAVIIEGARPRVRLSELRAWAKGRRPQ